MKIILLFAGLHFCQMFPLKMLQEKIWAFCLTSFFFLIQFFA